MFFVAVVVELELVTAPNRALAWFDHSRGIYLFFFSLFAHLDTPFWSFLPGLVFLLALHLCPTDLSLRLHMDFPLGSEASKFV